MITHLLDELDAWIKARRRARIRRLHPPTTPAEVLADMFDLPRGLVAVPEGTYDNAATQLDAERAHYGAFAAHLRETLTADEAARIEDEVAQSPEVEQWALIVDADTDPEDAIALWEADAKRAGWTATEDSRPGIQKNAGTGELLVEGDVIR